MSISKYLQKDNSRKEVFPMEKLAIISDIHGNLPALEAVLSDIKARGITRIICLGDIAGKGPDSDAAVDMIRENCEIVVKGNWEYFMTECDDNKTILWHRKKLGQERLEYLKRLPMYAEFFMSGRLIRLCHAAPDDVFYRVPCTADYEEKKTLFKDPNGGNNRANVIGYGDIHKAYMNSFEGKTIFNTGSVGNPLEIIQASYAVVEGDYGKKENSALSISLVRVPYDIGKAIKLAIKSGMPELEAYIKELKTAEYRGRI